MGDRLTWKTIRAGAGASCLSLCLAATSAWAEENNSPSPPIASESLGLMTGETAEPADLTPFSMSPGYDSGFEFDLGGIESRKLQLQLDQPLTLSTGSKARLLDTGGNLLGLDATLNVPVANNFSLTAGVDKQVGSARFHSLGSIQCNNGTLRADSYTASGCRFVNEPLATTDQQRIDLGARMNLGGASASIGWFTQDAALDQARPWQRGQLSGETGLGAGLLSPNLSNPLLATPGYDPLQYLNSEASGVDLNFRVGITTDTRGDIQLGLAFTRVLEANYEGLYSHGTEAMSWTLAEPFNSTRMNLEWSRGAFSGGIQGFYRDSVDFLNRNSVDSLTTFDVHFTWRTPWNANLSVGASNVLNAGSESQSVSENPPADPFESIYGRIPYVRYKQDL
jgi:hypothetical protein